MSGQPRLNMAQIQADIYMAGAAIKEVERLSAKKAKYLKGQAGYHLQQAAEKMIKIQMYALAENLNYAKMYRHSIDDLLIYAAALNIRIIVPDYVNKQKTVISTWEAEGRYDVHFVVRLPQLKKMYQEITAWFQALKDAGYK